MFPIDVFAALRDEVARIVDAFDPSVVPAADAAAIVRHAASIEAMAATVKAIAARRVAETSMWRDEGERTPAHHLARTTGTTIGHARDLLDTASRLDALPETAAATRRGELSSAQVVAIADAAAVAPDAEARLVAAAPTTSLAELRDECARTKAAALPDPEARHRAIHASRHLRRRRCPDGAAELSFRSTPDEVAEIWAVVERFTDGEFDRARSEGRREPLEACAADALLAVARAASGDTASTTGRRPAGSDTKVIVRVDHSALVRGRTLDDEVCEIAGLGPIAVSAVQEMLTRGDPFVAAILTRGTDIASVVHLGRKPITLQRTALQWRSPTCAVLGCNQVARLENDHRIEWQSTRHTTLDELDRLCPHHHGPKTRANWQLVDGADKRRMVPPGDPAHPVARAGPRAVVGRDAAAVPAVTQICIVRAPA